MPNPENPEKPDAFEDFLRQSRDGWPEKVKKDFEDLTNAVKKTAQTFQLFEIVRDYGTSPILIMTGAKALANLLQAIDGNPRPWLTDGIDDALGSLAAANPAKTDIVVPAGFVATSMPCLSTYRIRPAAGGATIEGFEGPNDDPQYQMFSSLIPTLHEYKTPEFWLHILYAPKLAPRPVLMLHEELERLAGIGEETD